MSPMPPADGAAGLRSARRRDRGAPADRAAAERSTASASPCSTTPSGTPTSCCAKAAERLAAEHRLGAVSYYRKESFSRVAAPALIAEIAADNDLVLTAIGD